MTTPRGRGAARKRHVVVVGHMVGDQFFGAERSLLDILAAIDRETYEVTCVLPAASDAYPDAASRDTSHLVVFPYAWWSRTRPVDLETVARFEAVFRKARADLVHVNTITLMDPLLAARRLGVPSIVHARELITHDAALAGLLGGDAGLAVRAVRTASDFIIANSNATHRIYRKNRRSFRVYNGVDVDRFDLPNAPTAGTLRVGMISNNQPNKGIEQFARLATLAARRSPGLEFLLIGPRNDHVAALEAAARAEAFPVNLRAVDYFADPVDAFRQVNVVVSLSLVAESFGRSVVEAMAARRPVIAYRWGALPELVRHGKDGFLVPYLDAARALDHLAFFADRPERVATMGSQARERAERLFSRAVFSRQLNDVYRRILDPSGTPPRGGPRGAAPQPAGSSGRTRAMRSVSSP